MTEFQFQLIVFALLMLNVASFLLGYDVSETRERTAKKQLDAAYRAETERRRQLTSWVQQNWPNEFDAYVRGHSEGFQQGFRAGEEDSDALTT
jgi:flagellar biosynthesis/type III secretory pathway protein FliH